MKLKFKHILPIPLMDFAHGENSIWNTSFDISSGARILLNAESGKGKTTFTELLAGIRRDYQGDFFFEDRNGKDLSLEDWANYRQEKLSFVFQDLQLFPNLTVEENLQIKNALTNHLSESVLKQMLERLGIADKWGTKCGLLSMGQQQRVAIVRALCQPFEWLILDEPFSHLDDENTQKALELIEENADVKQAGIILTTLGRNHQYKFTEELFL